LVGWNADTITNSYSTGTVIISGGLYVGGLVGYNDAGSGATVTSSYWDINTSGQSTSAGGTGEITSDMKEQITFSSWDFINTWNINEGVSYPFLQ
jgi:hypothetical protein